MEILLKKIQEYTLDGSPGVGQLIELQDIAKKEKVTRATLEKMIDQAIEANKQKEADFNQSFEIPNLENARDSFDKEMLARQEKEIQNIENNAQLFETREEVIFPELNVSFDKEKEEVFEYEMPELPNPKEALPEIVQQKEIISDFENVELEQHDVSFDSNETDFSVEKPKEVQNNVESIGGITFEPNEKNSKVEIEVTEEGEKLYGFEEALKEQNKVSENEDILRKIIAENKLASEKAERDKRAREKIKKTEKQTTSNQTNTRDKYFKTESKKNRKSDTVTLQQSKTIRTLGFIALFFAIATPFYILVFIGCGIGINLADKYKKTISENPNLYGEEIVKAVNTSFVLFIISMIIAFLKIWA